MAITNLKHLKYDNGRGKAHLFRLLNYIQNPKKTANGRLTWSNCGLFPQSQYDQMMETKRYFGKEDGRQGYHFVIAFPPDEDVSDETALAFGKDFAERFLHGDYEYVLAVHNDQAHKHIHLVFNSVRQTDGYKYHYKNGDWEKLVQPVTDKLCKEYGLKILEYEKKDPRKGTHYADHMKEKKGGITWKEIIRRDIDHAVSVADDLDSYFAEMHRMGYRIGRSGNLEGYGKYVTYHAPETDGLKSMRGTRDRALGEGYSLWEIEERIRGKALPVRESLDILSPGNEQPESKEKPLAPLKYIRMPNRELSRFQVCAVNRIRRMSDYHRMDLTIQEQTRVRKDLLSVEQLTEECNFVLDNNICDRTEAEIFLARIKSRLKEEGLDEKAINDLKQGRKILRRVLRHYEETMGVAEIHYVKMPGAEPQKKTVSEENSQVMIAGTIQDKM